MTRGLQVCFVIQLLSYALRLHLAAGQTSSQTAVCSVGTGSLVQCLQDPRVTHVVIEGDYSVNGSFAKYTATPLQLTRSAAPGTVGSLQQKDV